MLDDAEARERAESVERLILCSGKIFTELAVSDVREEAVDTAMARIELLYPFPEDRIKELLDGYPNLREIVWVQEEPKNMGAWTFVEPRLRALTGGELPVRTSASPPRPARPRARRRFHKQEHAGIVREAFESVEAEPGQQERAAEETQKRASAPSE